MEAEWFKITMLDPHGQRIEAKARVEGNLIITESRRRFSRFTGKGLGRSSLRIDPADFEKYRLQK